jgi:hypothetical protein
MGAGRSEACGEAQMGERTEGFEEAKGVREIGPEHFERSEGLVAVEPGREDPGGETGGGGRDVFLTGGGAEPAAFAREGQNSFVRENCWRKRASDD